MLVIIIGVLLLAASTGPGDYISVKDNKEPIHRPEPGANRR